MEFNKNRVYSFENRNEAKLGSLGYFTNSYLSLQNIISSVNEKNAYYYVPSVLTYISNNEYCFRDNLWERASYFYCIDDYLTVEEVLAELNSMHQEIPEDCYSRLYDLISQLSDGKIEKMSKKLKN